MNVFQNLTIMWNLQKKLKVVDGGALLFLKFFEKVKI